MPMIPELWITMKTIMKRKNRIDAIDNCVCRCRLCHVKRAYDEYQYQCQDGHAYLCSRVAHFTPINFVMIR